MRPPSIVLNIMVNLWRQSSAYDKFKFCFLELSEFLFWMSLILCWLNPWMQSLQIGRARCIELICSSCYYNYNISPHVCCLAGSLSYILQLKCHSTEKPPMTWSFWINNMIFWALLKILHYLSTDFRIIHKLAQQDTS